MKIYFLLFIITRAAITPGIQPIQVNIKTISIEPQPLSNTANGGKIIHNNTWRQDISFIAKIQFFFIYCANSVGITSIHLIPSIAADTIPPAYPAPSAQG